MTVVVLHLPFLSLTLRPGAKTMTLVSPAIFASVATTLVLFASLPPSRSFVAPRTATIARKAADAPTIDVARPRHAATATPTTLFSAASVASDAALLSLTLEKPLGLVLEETEDGTGGVTVTQVNEGGSAFESPSAAEIQGAKLVAVESRDVASLPFDDVMEAIIAAPSPLTVEFALAAAPAPASAETDVTDEAEAAAPTYAAGTPVAITVESPDGGAPARRIEAKVGDNLRKTLLANDVEVYRGLKKKLGNCGGGGQCGFCAVEVVDEEGAWGARSEYEAQRIGNNGGERCRLACLNNIPGPATVRTL